METVATFPSIGVVAFVGLSGLQVKASVVVPIQQWVGSYMRLVEPHLDGSSRTGHYHWAVLSFPTVG